MILIDGLDVLTFIGISPFNGLGFGSILLEPFVCDGVAAACANY